MVFARFSSPRIPSPYPAFPLSNPGRTQQNTTRFQGRPDRFQRSESAPKFGGGLEYSGSMRGWFGLFYHKNGVFPEAFKGYFQPGTSVCDIGCGPGAALGATLKTMECDVTSIDKQSTGDDIITADVSEMSPETFKNKFDVIVCSYSLFSYAGEDHDLRARTLKNIEAWLKPGGVLMVAPVNPVLTDNQGHSFKDLLAYTPKLQIDAEGETPDSTTALYKQDRRTFIKDPVYYMVLKKRA